MKHQYFTRSLFVAFCAFFVCVSALAGDLNPFAFKLSSELVGDVFNVNYYLNAPATSVKVTITLPNDQKVVYDCTDSLNTQGHPRVKGIYQLKISLREKINDVAAFRNQTNLRWYVNVTGGNTATWPQSGNSIANIKAAEYSLFAPASIDVDVDPMSDNFGMIYATEGRVAETGNEKYFSHVNENGVWKSGAIGLYVFDAAFQNMPSFDEKDGVKRYDFETPNNARTFARGYNLGLSTTYNSGTQAIFWSARSMAPRRVRISEDGRIFVSCWSVTGTYLQELNPARLRYDYRLSNGELNNDNWITNVFRGTLDGNDDDHPYHNSLGGGSTYILETANNEFVAAPNISFDVYNSGKNLKLFTLSGDKGSDKNYYRESFYFNQYNLGNNTTWSTKPSKSDYFTVTRAGKAYKNTIGFRGTDANKDGHGDGDPISVGVSYERTSVEYDPYGGVWYCLSRLLHNEAASLLHIKADGTIDYEEHVVNRDRGGVRYNTDNTKLVVAGGKITKQWFSTSSLSGYKLYDYEYNSDNSQVKLPSAELNYATVYNVNHPNANTAPQLESPVYVNLGYRPDDMAWDYANNLYIASWGDEKIAAYALPNGGKPVSTPCKDTYKFNTDASQLTVNIYPQNVNCGTVVDYEFQKSFAWYMNGATFKLEAKPNPGYRFVSWLRYNSQHDLVLANARTMAAGGLTMSADFGINVHEDTRIVDINADTDFKAVYVKRDLDTESYSTICLPFNLETLEGTPYEGASVLEFSNATPSQENGDNRIFLEFSEVEFATGRGMRAGQPYLIKVANPVIGEKMFWNVTCPDIDNQGQSVTKGDVTFHGLLNPTTFTKEQVKDKLFLTADNRLVSLYGQNSFSINGLRGYFTVKEGAKNVEYMLNLPEKVVTSTPMVNMADTLQVTKYLWNGQIYIQRGNEVYDLTGMRVR